MVAVAVALPVGIILVEREFFPSSGPIHGPQTFGKNAIAGAFEGHQFSRVGTLRRGIFRMGPVDVETAAVGEHLVQQSIVVRAGTLTLAFCFKAADVEQRVFILVVPNSLRRRQRRVMSDQLEGIGNRIGGFRIAGGDTKPRFRTKNALCNHWTSTIRLLKKTSSGVRITAW